MAAMAIFTTTTSQNQYELARTLRHEGIRVGEIIAYRAWRVFEPRWWWKGNDRLHSVYVQHYVWDPDEPASGDVRTHGIYSFRNMVRSKEEYSYPLSDNGLLLFGKIKIWGELVEHENGYRSQFAKLLSLDYGAAELLDKYRKIYRVNP
jgi:hypothetical protein